MNLLTPVPMSMSFIDDGRIHRPGVSATIGVIVDLSLSTPVSRSAKFHLNATNIEQSVAIKLKAYVSNENDPNALRSSVWSI